MRPRTSAASAEASRTLPPITEAHELVPPEGFAAAPAIVGPGGSRCFAAIMGVPLGGRLRYADQLSVAHYGRCAGQGRLARSNCIEQVAVEARSRRVHDRPRIWSVR